MHAIIRTKVNISSRKEMKPMATKKKAKKKVAKKVAKKKKK